MYNNGDDGGVCGCWMDETLDIATECCDKDASNNLKSNFDTICDTICA